jgi:hypothetical protein
MPHIADAPLAHLDHYRIIRGQIEHEDNLISGRLSWFIASQSFLFTAYAILVNGLHPAAATDGPNDSRRLLLVLVSALAAATCVLIFLSILSGVAAMANLRRLYDRTVAGHPGELPPVQGYRSTQLLGLAAPILLPILFMSVWLFLLLRRLV